MIHSYRVPTIGLFAFLVTASCGSRFYADEIVRPKVPDGRLQIELVAADPDIVTPTGIAVDARGRVLCIESHTHFRPEGYQGPAADRIRMYEDTDGDYRADKITTFFEGTTHTMNVAVSHDGSVFVATRNEIFRLRDTDADGAADQRTPIIQLETEGNYPHNGLSGFAFDLLGHMYFGLGENLGADYKLVGTDGAELTGGGEGGNVYRCKLDGSQLQRIATGFWNPFHVCVDVFGRLFAVDNDPDWRPPCRLLHVVAGGDYGYRYDLGRRGIHPFTSWFGEFPGTLGMVSGTGEAPSGVLSYDSDNLPLDYRGDLLATSWGMHAIERFRLARKGASFVSTPEAIVKGDRNFRPVGIALAPDGSLYISDWVDRSYKLHGKGRIWRLSKKGHAAPSRPADAKLAIKSKHRPTRERAASQLVKQRDAGLEILRSQLHDEDPHVRATALSAIIVVGGAKDVAEQVLGDASSDVRELALAVLPLRSFDLAASIKSAKTDAERAAAIRRLGETASPGAIEFPLEFFSSADPFVQQAARQALAPITTVERRLELARHRDADVRLHAAMVLRDNDGELGRQILPELLKESDARHQLVAVRWIGEAKLKDFEPRLLDGLNSNATTARVFEAYLAAIEMLRDTPGQQFEDQLKRIITDLLTDDNTSPTVLELGLRKLRGIETRKFGDSDDSAISVERLQMFTKHDHAGVRLEAVRSLRESTDSRRMAILVGIARDSSAAVQLRAEAIVGLSPTGESRELLLDLAGDLDRTLRAEALRALRGETFSKSETRQLRAVERKYSALKPLVHRLTDSQWKPTGRPEPGQIDRWVNLAKDVAGRSADVSAGERVFFHPKGPQCAACHQINGRGGTVGPDLSAVGRLSRQRLLESILSPSREMAPRFVPWNIAKVDGTVFSGILVSERGEEEIYADSKGKLIYIDHSDIDQRQPSAKSIMPDQLVDQLTDQELRDLLTYLQAQK